MSGKRMKLSLKKNPVIVHQNLQVVPPPPAPGFDEEGRLPESLGPTPVVDLITEDEASEVERTPRPPMSPTIARSSWRRGATPSCSIDHDAIERDAAEAATPPPTLLRLSGGKNLAMIRSMVAPPPASPTPSETSSVGSLSGSGPTNVAEILAEERRRLELIEAERRRLEEGKQKLIGLAQRIRRKRGKNEEEIAALERQIATLQESLQRRIAVRERYDFEMEAIGDFCA